MPQHRFATTTVACAAVFLATGWISTAAVASAPAATPAAPTALSISVDNGHSAVGEGDRLTYQIKVRNVGAGPARGVQVTQSLPTGLRLITASRGGVKGAGRVSWLADVPVGGVTTFSITAVVGKTPATLLRLATVACARAAGTAKPMVCATHSDQLPAGALVEAALRRPATPRTSGWWWSAIVAVCVLGMALATLFLLPAVRRWPGWPGWLRAGWLSRLR